MERDKHKYNIYLASAIIAALLIFMIITLFSVMETIGGGKTSADLAINKAKKDCDKKKRKLVRSNENNRLNTACIVDPDKKK